MYPLSADPGQGCVLGVWPHAVRSMGVRAGVCVCALCVCREQEYRQYIQTSNHGLSLIRIFPAR